MFELGVDQMYVDPHTAARYGHGAFQSRIHSHSRAISGSNLVVFLKCIAEVREITRNVPIFASSPMSDSVTPSATYSWPASPERLRKGSTTNDRIGDVGDMLGAASSSGEMSEATRSLADGL